ncbi:hypothetical protein CSPB12327_00180 [Campylobacter sp. RM12327]|uniref:hypothetical protein n=1 Tax=Campylobacter sputorum TaxID=206 RepID=UPI001374753A|nr:MULTISPECIES: hypothetical protein [Campylobacter]ASM40455.1 hypothetical protein CSPB_1263 [Campylobacter sputorum]MBE7357270.1 hypothetical protein [Campylobacter sp. RM11302]MBF6668580.1 hypothetical protein [Campylobacter sp. RM12327]MBF6674165.1 hypothetical protein [Campylobacter sp. RM13538]MBF6675634.1 hypothetical protein [Campylobacter sp. RM12321]
MIFVVIILFLIVIIFIVDAVFYPNYSVIDQNRSTFYEKNVSEDYDSIKYFNEHINKDK